MRIATCPTPTAVYLRAGASAQCAAWCYLLSWPAAGEHNLPAHEVDAAPPRLVRSGTARVQVDFTQLQRDDPASAASAGEDDGRAL